MRTIYVKNNTINTRIIITDDNDEIIFAEEYKEINARLMDDNMIVDRKTIAELCGMTEEEFRSKYDLMHCESRRVFGEPALINARFEEYKEEPKKAGKTMANTIDTWKIDRAFKAIDMYNVIDIMYQSPITELTKEDINTITAVRDLFSEADEIADYGDAVCEAIIELNTILLYKVYAV